MASVATALIGSFVLAQQNLDEIDVDRRSQENEDGTRRAVGLWLKDHTPLEAIVAMEAIGYQGYYSERKVIDLAGLVSPKIVALQRESSSNAEVLDKVLVRAKPDYLVLRSHEVEENQHFYGGALFDDDAQRVYFETHYTMRAAFTAPHPEDWGTAARISIYGREPDEEVTPPRTQ